MVIYLTYCGLLAIAACSDLSAFRIPNWVSIALVVLFLVNSLPQHVEVAWQTHLAAGAVMLTGGLCLYAVGTMGAGDVKLLAVTSLWLGLPILPNYLLMVALAGLAMALVLVAVRRLTSERLMKLRRWVPASFLPSNRVPYGVAIAVSAVQTAGNLPLSTWLF